MGKRHAACAAQSPTARLVAVFDANREAAQALAGEHGARTFDRAEDMICADVIDALLLCTPPSFRNEYALPALESGIHVLMEKPIARHMAPAVELARGAAKARGRGVVAAVGYVWRHSAVVRRLQELFRDCRPCLVDGAIYHGRPPEAYMWLRNKQSGGGQIVDMTTHIINTLQAVIGEVDSVYAQATTGLLTDEPGFVNDDASALALCLAHDVVANLSNTYALFHAKHTAERHGVQVHVIGRHLHAWWRGGVLEIIRPEGIETVEGGPDFDAQFAEFAAAARGRRPDAVQADVAQSLRTLAVTLAANESIETGRVVDMREFLVRHGAQDFAEPERAPAG